MDAPSQGDSGGHTGTAPTHFIIFFHTIPCKQNNHLCATHPNGANRPTRNLPKRNRRGEHPRAILSSKMRRGGAYVPARTSAQRRFHTNVFIYKTTIHLI
ncbi:hypothetical protein [Segatella oulorum]|uniref:hypothetical protein n=1 Tax=Segatella oulorum TaxID=28136 RepID=UPI00131EEAFC|nr:hypothetical protein [Segatella oulorum]